MLRCCGDKVDQLEQGKDGLTQREHISEGNGWHRLDACVLGFHVVGAPLLPFTFTSGWWTTGAGGNAAGRLGRYGSVGNKPLTRVDRDCVCESTSFLQATSGNPAEGAMVTVKPSTWEKPFMKNKSNIRPGRRRGGESDALKAARDNRADQLNRNNDKYHRARGLTGRPDGSGGGTPSSSRKR